MLFSDLLGLSIIGLSTVEATVIVQWCKHPLMQRKEIFYLMTYLDSLLLDYLLLWPQL